MMIAASPPRPLAGSPTRRLARWQIGMLHAVPARMGIDEADRRNIQRNVGGADSAAIMGPGGFAAVMAFYESMGWQDPSRRPRFWADAAGDDAGPLRGKAIRLAAIAGWTDLDAPDAGRVDFSRLDAFCIRQTAGARERLADCDRAELYTVIEGLKEICRRQPVSAAILEDRG